MENEDIKEDIPESDTSENTNIEINKLKEDIARLTRELEQAKALANEPRQEQSEKSDFDRIFRGEI